MSRPSKRLRSIPSEFARSTRPWLSLNVVTTSSQRFTLTCTPCGQSSSYPANRKRVPMLASVKKRRSRTDELSRTPSNSTSCLLLTPSSIPLWLLILDSATSCITDFVGIRTVSRKLSAKCSSSESPAPSVCELVSHQEMDFSMLVMHCMHVELMFNRVTKGSIITGTWRCIFTEVVYLDRGVVSLSHTWNVHHSVGGLCLCIGTVLRTL